MVEKYVSVRNKLDSKVFIPYGKTVTFISKSSPTYNIRGELDTETSTSSDLAIVPYNLVTNRQSFEKFGPLEEGDFDAAVRYDTVINVDDEIVLDTIYYKVKEIAEEHLKEIVVIIIRLIKA